MSARSVALPALNRARGIIQRHELRRYAVTIRLRTWSGGRVGSGTATNADLLLTPTPRVRQLSAREIASSGGTYEEGDYRVDRITPAFATPAPGGGYTPEQLRPRLVAGGAVDLVIVLVGDDGTKICTPVGPLSFDRALSYAMVVRPRRESAKP